MIEFIVTIVYCIILIILSILFAKKQFFSFLTEKNLQESCVFIYPYLYFLFRFMEGINSMFRKSKIFVRIVIMSIRRMRNLTIALNAMQN